MIFLVSFRRICLVTIMFISIFCIGNILEINWTSLLLKLKCKVANFRHKTLIWKLLRSGFSLVFVILDIFFQYLTFLYYILDVMIWSTVDVVSQWIPAVHLCLLSVVSVCAWVATKILQGIFLQADQMTMFVSWISVGCILVLYLDKKYNRTPPIEFRNNDTERLNEINFTANHNNINRETSEDCNNIVQQRGAIAINRTDLIRARKQLRTRSQRQDSTLFTNIRRKSRYQNSDYNVRCSDTRSEPRQIRIQNRQRNEHLNVTQSNTPENILRNRTLPSFRTQASQRNDSATHDVQFQNVDLLNEQSFYDEFSYSDVSDIDEDDNDLFEDPPQYLDNESDRSSDEDDVIGLTRNIVNMNQSECSICMKEKRCVAIFPCGHTHFCLGCIVKVMAANKKCPICTKPIHSYNKVFI